jgi:hypothetical protein
MVKLSGWPPGGTALLALVFFGVLQNARVARAGEPKLADDEAIVLCRGVSTTLRNVEYWRIGTKSGFFVSMRGSLTPKVVKAGRYYLHSYSTIYRNVFPPIFPEPGNTAATVEIRAGSVTYLGDMAASPVRDFRRIRWNFTIAFRPATLIDAEKSFPWLRKYPLYVPKDGGEVVPVRWSTDPLPPPVEPGERRYGDGGPPARAPEGQIRLSLSRAQP